MGGHPVALVDATAMAEPDGVDMGRIPALAHAEAAAMATVELERFLALLAGLEQDDWTRPTICDLWNVREMVAHVAGAAASYARWSEFRHQWNPFAFRRHRRAGFGVLAAVNQLQISDRARAAPADLIAELREAGPRAIATRRNLPARLRALRLPIPELGVVPVGYLTDVIYTRDMWAHRLDIARATGREMTLAPEHDGRVIALMMRDLGPRLDPVRGGATISFTLTGAAGGAYRRGPDARPAVRFRLDALDLAWLAMGRAKPAMRDRITISGDPALAERVLNTISVPA